MKNWALKISIEVSDNWIQDGANPSEWTEQIQQLIESNFLGYAYPNEFKVGVTVSKEPTQKEIEDIVNAD